jgi:hypothetical protein
VWKDEGRDERQIDVGMIARILRSCRRIKNAVKVELVQNGVPLSTKLGVLGVDSAGGERIPRLYLNILGRRDVEAGMKNCIQRHAKHCYRRSSQVQVFLPREEGDVDPRGVLLGVDTEKK